MRLILLLAILTLVTVAGLALVILRQPHWLIAELAKRSPDVLYFVETSTPIVALTIDDGPDPDVTPAMLETLARFDARATFFLISDRIAGNEGLVSEIVERGHELGNHLSRDQRSIGLPAHEFERALLEASGVLSKFAPVRWLRPAGGWYNSAIVSTARAHGYRVTLGSIYPYDAHIPSAGFAARHVLRKIRPGAIIVLHDGGNRGMRTVAALERILPELGRRGFNVVTLSELAESAPALHGQRRGER